MYYIIHYVEREKNFSSRKAVKRIHKQLNHKKTHHTEYAYRCAGKMDDRIKKKIKEVVGACYIPKE